MKQPFTLEWRIPKEAEGQLLREFLKEHNISKTALTDIKFNGGSIKVNNQEMNVRYRLNEQDLLQVSFPPEVASDNVKPEAIPLHIVYEDGYLLVINKQAGMASIPSRQHLSGTLSNALLYYYQETGISSTIHLVNRLDRDTSGLLIVAKHRYVHYLFSKAHETKMIRRTYRAIVHGCIQSVEGTIDAPIARSEDSIITRTVADHGQRSITHYSVVEQCSDYSYISIQLETGRTHQIRVHFSHLNHPLLGDDLYGGNREWIARQALHSYEVTFYHPIFHKELCFTAPLPHDMKAILERERTI
ncbi:RluA family pseudouridine synthase [Priestia koreensis]|uniref:RluA family pseudouridine synthase n=1 Tax=Priestia koreensis TaxID=284581 RepID=UPI001F59326B|nr:RluA family pseudouridine synthase [Priestia koreensis]UNL85675.1 RluA family pseudouridine synthase [Priestia koreensis]